MKKPKPIKLSAGAIDIFNAVVNDMKKRGVQGADKIPAVVIESVNTDNKNKSNGGTD